MYSLQAVSTGPIAVTARPRTGAAPAPTTLTNGDSLTLDFSNIGYTVTGTLPDGVSSMDWNQYGKYLQFNLPEVQPLVNTPTGITIPTVYSINLSTYRTASGAGATLNLNVSSSEFWLSTDPNTKIAYGPNEQLQIIVDKYAVYVYHIGYVLALQFRFPTPLTNTASSGGVSFTFRLNSVNDLTVEQQRTATTSTQTIEGAPGAVVSSSGYQMPLPNVGELTYSLAGFYLYPFAAPTSEGSAPNPDSWGVPTTTVAETTTAEETTTAGETTTTLAPFDPSNLNFSLSRPDQDWQIVRDDTTGLYSFAEDYVVGTITVEQSWMDYQIGNAAIQWRVGKPTDPPNQEQIIMSTPGIPISALTTNVKLSDFGSEFQNSLAAQIAQTYLQDGFDWSAIAVDPSDPQKSFFYEVKPETGMEKFARAVPQYYKISLATPTTTGAPSEESTTSLDESGTAANGKGSNSGAPAGNVDITDVRIELEKPAGDWIVTQPGGDPGANFQFAEDYDIGTITVSQSYLDKNIGPVQIGIGMGKPENTLQIYGLQLTNPLSATTTTVKLSDCTEESRSAAANVFGRKILAGYPLAETAPDPANPNAQFYLEVQAQSQPTLKSRSPAEGSYFSIALDPALTTTTVEETTTAEETTTLDGIAEQIPSEPIATGGRRKAHRVSRGKRKPGRRQSKRAAKAHGKTRHGKKKVRKTTRRN